MKQITTFVGIDAHKKYLDMAMPIGNPGRPVTWTPPNDRRRSAGW